MKVRNPLFQLKNISMDLDTKTYVLQFTENRVAQPSVKNFQMVIETDTRMYSLVDQSLFDSKFLL